MADINLLRAGSIQPWKVSERGAFRLEFRKGVQGVVVIEVVIDSRLLVIGKSVINLDLELIAAVRPFRDCHDLTVAPPCPRHVLQEGKCHWVKTSARNLVPWEYGGVWHGPTAVAHRVYRCLRTRSKLLACRQGSRRAAAATVLQDIRGGRIDQRAAKRRTA